MKRKASTSLWRHAPFLKLWLGQTISLVGSQVTLLALPLTGLLILHASAFQMGLLGMVQYLPFLFVSLLAGVWIDHLPRRPLLILADIGRAILLGCIPLLALFHFLRMEYLYLLAGLIGLCTVFFDIAYTTFLPQLLSSEKLIEGNSRLQMSESLAQISGPGLAGFVIQVLSAPLALLIDAGSFLFSAAFLASTHLRETSKAVQRKRKAQPLLVSIREGLHLVFTHPVLRAFAGCGGTANLCTNARLAILLLYLNRTLSLPAFLIGLLYTLGSFGSLLGAWHVQREIKRRGIGWVILYTQVLAGGGALLIPGAFGAPWLLIGLLALAQAIWGYAAMGYSVASLSLRQAMIPDEYLGRVTATLRWIGWGGASLGYLLGGIAGTYLGLRITLVLAGLGELLSALWIFSSPLRTKSFSFSSLLTGDEAGKKEGNTPKEILLVYGLELENGEERKASENTK